MDKNWVCIASLLVSGLVSLAGCGGGDGGRAKVQGQITYGGVAIKDGAINLVPLDAELRRVGGPITDGAYELAGEQSGPLPGKYRVEIYAFEPIGAPAGGESDDADAESATRQIIPPKFNSKSTLELEVVGPEMEKSFSLEL